MVNQGNIELYFACDEFENRIANARRVLKERCLAALLIFAPESHYYLTGFDTTGFVFFQCGVLTADESPVTVLTRRPDVLQGKERSILTDIRVWYDAEGVNPAEELKSILAEKGLAGESVGIELDNFGLTGFNHQRVVSALADWCHLENGSDIIRSLRVVKSLTEIAYVRRAAELADQAMPAMIEAARPGALDSLIAAAGLTVMLAGGADVPPGAPLINSGRRALYGRGVAGPRVLLENDQVTIEFASTFRRYNVCLMRTALIGKPDPRHIEIHAVTRDAIAAMTEAAAPGEPLGRIDEAHRRVYDNAGYSVHRFAACGYSLGATYRPSWMDVPPMLYTGNPMPARPGMVLFLHAICPNADSGLAMSIGHTILITENGREVLSRLSHDLPVVS
jgi:Xaa-Pro dipeptidase